MSSAPVFEHRLTRRVQFHETDAAGVVHFSRYFVYVEEAEHALWRSDVGWPRVHASFDYHRALRFEDEFEAWIRIVAIDEKTISYVCTLSRGDTRIATGRLTIACATRQPNQPMRAAPIPPEVLSRLAVAPSTGAAKRDES